MGGTPITSQRRRISLENVSLHKLNPFASIAVYNVTSFSNLLFPSSSKEIFLNETVIPIKSIAYIQIGSEDLEEGHQQLAESLKTISASPASLYISAGDKSVRIRLRNDTVAKQLADTLRALILGDTGNIWRGRSKSVEMDEVLLERDQAPYEFEAKNPLQAEKFEIE